MTDEFPILQVEAVTLQFGGVRALDSVSFAVETGELYSIIGPNGAGKTSMLNCISGRYAPSNGTVLFNGADVTRLRPSARAELG